MGQDRALLNREMLTSAIGAAIGDRWSTSEVAAAAELLIETDGQFPKRIKDLPPDLSDLMAAVQREGKGSGPGPKRVGRLPSELVKAVQRERILAAMLRAIAEIGYHDVRVQHVLDLAGVSRPTFYEQFKDKEDCFLAAFDAAAKRLRDRIEAAVGDGGPHWRDRVRMGVEELLRFIAAEPDAARTLIVESRGAGAVGVLRHDDLFEHFARCIDAQVHDELPEAPSEIAADGVVGGIASVLSARLNRDELDDLDSLLPSLMYFAVLPYAGHEAAVEELSGGAPA
jgi:AcrR family transcriptional regulator